jgi:hypothetical protein
MRQHTPAYVSIRQHTELESAESLLTSETRTHTYTYIHTYLSHTYTYIHIPFTSVRHALEFQNINNVILFMDCEPVQSDMHRLECADVC